MNNSNKSDVGEELLSMKSSKKRIKPVFILLGIALLFISIGVLLAVLPKDKSDSDITNNDNNVVDSDNNNDDNNSNIEEKEVQIIDVNSKTRPYAVMINCHNAALPQAGLDKAYIVYELMVESGITRMMALFKDIDSDKIGSVRSARTQYLGYVLENDAIYVHAGGAPDALERISSEKFADIDVDGKYGVRDKNLKRAYEHTLFTKTSLLEKGTSDKKLRDTTETSNLLTYSANELDLSKYQTVSANDVSIKYSNYRTSNYEYDSNTKTYLRSMNSKDNTDLVTGEQYKVKNIIVYAVKYSTYTSHNYSGYQKVDNIGTGEGYYITNGVALPITWSKSSESSQTVYKIKETGENLIVNDGNTYIQIYPTSGKLTIN